MTMSKDRRELYPSMREAEITAIDAAYTEIRHVMRRHKIKIKGDDRAENLVGAIARFIEDSKRD